MRSFTIYDVFTDTAFTGNPLAIVEDADALTTEQMQTITRQFNLSETIFLQTPETPEGTAKVRIFTPGAEIPFAGHPTIGCALYLAATRDLSHVVLEEVAGLVPVTISGDPKVAEFTAPRVPAPIGNTPAKASVARAIGLTERDLGPHQIGNFEAGPAFLFAQVTDRAALAAAVPQEPAWSTMMSEAAIDDAGRSGVGLYLYTADAEGDYQARMFAPNDGIPEDPATGAATAIFAGQLLANGALQDGTTTLHIAQGVEMGRPSALRLSVDLADDAITAIRVAGQAVHVAAGQIRLP